MTTPSEPRSVQRFARSLAVSTLLKLAACVAAVIALTTALSYFYIFSAVEAQALEGLQKFVAERCARESQFLTSAEQHLAALHSAARTRLTEAGSTDPQEEFNRLTELRPDGTTRTRPGLGGDLYIFIPRGVDIDAEVRRRAVAFHTLCRDFGPAWKDHPGCGVFMIDARNFNVEYSGLGRTFGEAAAPDEDLKRYNSWKRSTAAENTTRGPVWGTAYWISNLKYWDVSVTRPLDWEGKPIAALCVCIDIERLLQRTARSEFAGGQNFLLNRDGAPLISPVQGFAMPAGFVPERTAQISALVQRAKPGQTLLNDPDSPDYLAIGRIDGPDWYFITGLSKALLREDAARSASRILLVGAFALLLEIVLIFWVLRAQVAQPMNALAQATDRMAEGDFSVRVTSGSTDELGRLALAFNTMAQGLAERDAHIKAHARDLEEQVAARTVELEMAHNEQLVQAAKLVSLGTLVASVAHEVNNPNHSILGNTQFISRVWDDALRILEEHAQREPELRIAGLPYSQVRETVPQLLQATLECSRRIRTYVDDLKRYARKEPMELTHGVDVCAVVRAGVALVERAVSRSGCTLSLQLPEQPVLVFGNFQRLEQVLVNLLQNGCEACEAPEILQRRVAVSIDVEREAGTATVHVRDTGIGFDPAQLARLSEPFYSTKQSRTNIGLGLAIAFMIVKQHNGRLAFDSAPGMGTHASFTLSLSTATSAESFIDSKEAASL